MTQEIRTGKQVQAELDPLMDRPSEEYRKALLALLRDPGRPAPENDGFRRSLISILKRGKGLRLSAKEVLRIHCETRAGRILGLGPRELRVLIDSGAAENFWAGLAREPDVTETEVEQAVVLHQIVGLLSHDPDTQADDRQVLHFARLDLAAATAETLAQSMSVSKSALYGYADRYSDQQPGPEHLERAAVFFRTFADVFARTADRLAEASRTATPVRRGRPPKRKP
jgi:hypothetical protein